MLAYLFEKGTYIHFPKCKEELRDKVGKREK